MAPRYERIIESCNLGSLTFALQIMLRVEINEEEGSAVFDFEGTGPEVRNNLNTPTPVVHSAVIYCMRAMLDVDIPLNAGCLVPLESAFHSTGAKCRISLITPSINISQDPQEVPLTALSNSSGLRRERTHIATYC